MNMQKKLVVGRVPPPPRKPRRVRIRGRLYTRNPNGWLERPLRDGVSLRIYRERIRGPKGGYTLGWQARVMVRAIVADATASIGPVSVTAAGAVKGLRRTLIQEVNAI